MKALLITLFLVTSSGLSIAQDSQDQLILLQQINGGFICQNEKRIDFLCETSSCENCNVVDFMNLD